MRYDHLSNIQRELIERLHGQTSGAGALAEHFEIPCDGPFDIIIVPHVFVHRGIPFSSSPRCDGSLPHADGFIFCEEPDDVRLFKRGKNRSSELKCFHFQQVDEPADTRALERQGFDVAVSGPKEPGRPSAEMFALASLSKKAKFEPRPDDVLVGLSQHKAS